MNELVGMEKRGVDTMEQVDYVNGMHQVNRATEIDRIN